MPKVNVEFKHTKEGLALGITARVSAYWGHQKDTCAFTGYETLDLRAGWRIRVTVEVHAWPKELGRTAEVFPENLEGSYGDPSLNYSLKAGILKLYAAIGRHLTYLEGARKYGFHRQFSEPLRTATRLKYYVTLRVTLTQPDLVVPGKIIERDLLPFFPGGLPSLGKRA